MATNKMQMAADQVLKRFSRQIRKEDASRGKGSIGVAGTGGYGCEFGGDQAPLRLIPAQTAGAPTTGEHSVGEFYVDGKGSLFYCLSAGTPGTWKRIELV